MGVTSRHIVDRFFGPVGPVRIVLNCVWQSIAMHLVVAYDQNVRKRDLCTQRRQKSRAASEDGISVVRAMQVFSAA